MKHTFYKKSARYVGSILLILLFTFASTGASSQSLIERRSASQIAISNYLAAQQNPDLSDEEEIKAAIDAYFTLRYESLKLLQAQDFSVLVEDNALDWVKKEKDKQDIEIYIATLYNSPYVSYSYTLDYDSISIDKKKATVQLRESNEVVTLLDMATSKMGNLQHIFTLHKKGGVWVIYKDEYQDELSQGLTYQTKEELLQQVDKNYQKSKQQISTSADTPLAGVIAQPLALTTYPYNRTLAYNYAYTYWNTASPPRYVGLAQDCANFVSQCMYAGEGWTPPNTTGMGIGGNYYSDWYYVWDSSGSLPWINVINQYSFITGNTSRIGPYGSGTAAFCNAQIGDVVQIKNASGWFHEGIVVGKSSSCYGPQSLYVAAHTTNR